MQKSVQRIHATSLECGRYTNAKGSTDSYGLQYIGGKVLEGKNAQLTHA
jgi:hypothetical protein